MIALPEQIEKANRYSFDFAEHVHRLDGKPLMGTSTVVDVIGKYLTWWASGMALTPMGWLSTKKFSLADRMAAADKALLKITDMTRREYVDYLQVCYRAHHTRKETAAVTGTTMHADLEEYVKECRYVNAGTPLVIGDTYKSDKPEVCRFAEWACANVSEFLWSEGHCYSERLWTGGICDCGAWLKGGRLAIIDFKSSREAYFSQLVQCGGYAVQILENGVLDCNGVTIMDGSTLTNANSIMVFPFGGDATEPHARYDVARYQKLFEAAVVLYEGRRDFEGNDKF